MEDNTQTAETLAGTNPSPPAPTGPAADAKGAAGEIAAAAGDIARDAQSRVASLAGEAKDRLACAAEDGKGDVADAIQAVAGAVHQTAENLQGQDWLAQMIERGADELGSLAETLRGNDLQGLLGKLDELARSHPAIFVGAAMAIGFGATRLGKSVVAGASEADLPKLPGASHGPN